MSDDVELADVEVHVSAVRPVRHGRIEYEFDAVLTIAGIEIELVGGTIRSEEPRRLYASLPQTRINGVWQDCIHLPPSVARAVATCALEQAGGTLLKVGEE